MRYYMLALIINMGDGVAKHGNYYAHIISGELDLAGVKADAAEVNRVGPNDVVITSFQEISEGQYRGLVYQARARS
jgi:hypothetical protein